MKTQSILKAGAAVSVLMIIAGCSSSDTDNGDSIGGGSNPSTVIVTQEAELMDTGPQVNSSNFDEVTLRSVEAINLVSLGEQQVLADSLLADIDQAGTELRDGGAAYAGLTLAFENETDVDNGGNNWLQSYTCDDGGSLELILSDFNGGPIEDRRVTFNECSLGGAIHNGAILSFAARRSDAKVSFRNYTRMADGNSVAINGEYINRYPWFANSESREWVDTTYSVTSGASTTKISNLTWRLSGSNTYYPDSVTGTVVLPDGTSQRIYELVYGSDLDASFTLIDETLPQPLQVSASLSFNDNYLSWVQQEQASDVAPPFSITDLGDTDVTVTTGVEGETQTVRVNVRDTNAQWQTGEVRIEAPDTSLIVLRPDAEQRTALQLELNDAGEPETRLWADGYQITCASVVEGCGQTE